MITDFLNNIKDVLILGGFVTESKITNYQFFAPSSYPSSAIDVAGGSLVNDTYSVAVQDCVYSVNVVYLEKAPADKDKLSFIQNVENVCKAIRSDTVLNNMCQGLSIRCDMRERGTSDNLEFISIINIVGTIEI